jgi:hypothetical protein
MTLRDLICRSLAGCMVLSCVAQQRSVPIAGPAGGGMALRHGFAVPPPSARLRCYWWWLNGNTTEATIDRDLQAMAAKGYGGALLVDANGSNQNGNRDVPAGPAFASPAWVKLYLHALGEARRLHLEISFNITSGWNLGGPGVTPEDGSKVLAWTRQMATASPTQHLAAPAAKNGFYRQIAVLAYPLRHGEPLPGLGSPRPAIRDLPFKSASAETGFSMPDLPLLQDVAPQAGEQDADLGQVIDLSAQTAADGTLAWQPPDASAWEILRIGYTDSDARVSTSSGSWQGLAIDYMDHEAFDRYWTATVQPLLAAAKPYIGTSLKYLVSDSWELGGTNWTGRFRQEFKARRGYDPVPYLPIVAGRIIGSRDLSNKFLADLRRTVGDLIVAEHYDVFAAHAKAYGLGIHPESGGPHGAPLDALETWRNAAFPQSEYWAQSREHRQTGPERFFTKEAASAANIYGKPFAAQEGMTSIGPQWSESLATDLKPSFDQGITEGMNRLVWHEFTSSPASAGLPGQEYFAGTHLNPQVTWWSQADAFLLYLNRCQFLMQQGYAVSDVLYYYGDQVPNFVRLKADDPARALPGFDYDVTGEDALLHSLRFAHGTVTTPAGNHYSAVVLPKTRNLTLPALEKLERYVREGGLLIGMPSTESTGIVDAAVAAKVSALTDELFRACGADASTQAHPVGLGHVVCTGDSHEALIALGEQQDFVSRALAPLPGQQPLDYAHRRATQGDIYFVRNPNAYATHATATFRVSGSRPQLWDAVTGSLSDPQFTQDASTTEVPLEMPAFGSVFVMFLHDAGLAPGATQLAATPVALGPQWNVTFEPGRGAPVATTMTELTDWSKNSDPGIRYFSGTATYRNEFALTSVPAAGMTIALTELHEICTVRVNGMAAGTIWALPYRLVVPASLVRAGRNTIELEVTNLWPNRIIGDLQPGVTVPITHTNIRKYTAQSPLFASGLIGPVTLTLRAAPVETTHR